MALRFILFFEVMRRRYVVPIYVDERVAFTEVVLEDYWQYRELDYVIYKWEEPVYIVDISGPVAHIPVYMQEAHFVRDRARFGFFVVWDYVDPMVEDKTVYSYENVRQETEQNIVADLALMRWSTIWRWDLTVFDLYNVLPPVRPMLFSYEPLYMFDAWNIRPAPIEEGQLM